MPSAVDFPASSKECRAIVDWGLALMYARRDRHTLHRESRHPDIGADVRQNENGRLLCFDVQTSSLQSFFCKYTFAPALPPTPAVPKAHQRQLAKVMRAAKTVGSVCDMAHIFSTHNRAPLRVVG